MAGFKRQALDDEDRGRKAVALGELAAEGLGVFCWCNRCGGVEGDAAAGGRGGGGEEEGGGGGAPRWRMRGQKKDEWWYEDLRWLGLTLRFRGLGL